MKLEFMSGTWWIYRSPNRKLVLSVSKLLSDLCDLCVCVTWNSVLEFSVTFPLLWASSINYVGCGLKILTVIVWKGWKSFGDYGFFSRLFRLYLLWWMFVSSGIFLHWLNEKKNEVKSLKIMEIRVFALPFMYLIIGKYSSVVIAAAQRSAIKQCLRFEPKKRFNWIQYWCSLKKKTKSLLSFELPLYISSWIWSSFRRNTCVWRFVQVIVEIPSSNHEHEM